MTRQTFPLITISPICISQSLLFVLFSYRAALMILIFMIHILQTPGILGSELVLDELHLVIRARWLQRDVKGIRTGASVWPA